MKRRASRRRLKGRGMRKKKSGEIDNIETRNKSGENRVTKFEG